MRLYIGIFILSIFALSISAEEDMSELYFTVNTFTENTYVQLLVKDSFGKKTGCSNICFREISNSSFGKDSVDNIETGNAGIENMTVRISPVSKGIYQLTVFASTNTNYEFSIQADDLHGKNINLIQDLHIGYMLQNTTQQYSVYLDPAPGASALVINKQVDFQLLRDDINAAYKLNQIGEEKFANSLIKMINMAEKIYDKCEKTDKKDGDKNKKCYRPVISVLRMFVKRLEITNKKCDKTAACDEEKEWNNFHDKYGKDKDLKEFFSEWEKDEWHKYKKSCKRFVSEEALDIVSSDVNWYVKGIGEEAWSEYKKEHKPYISSKTKEQFK